jgi:putative spermidine/putrescine transport system permease protein
MMRQRRIGLGVISTLVGLLVALPTLVVVPMSFTGEVSFSFPPHSWSVRWYRSFFESEAWRSSLTFSIEVALCVMVLATVLGGAIAFGLRSLPARLAAVVQSLVLIPMIIPTVVTAIAVYESFLRWHLSGTLLGFTLAQTVVVLPFVVLSFGVGLSRINPRLLQAAATLGARPSVVFVRVLLPLMLPSVLTSMLLSFVGSLDEATIALFLSSPTRQTLPVQMYNSMLEVTDPTVAAASSILLTLVVIGGVVGLIVVPRIRRSRSDVGA